jgi:hypothetical protein
MRRVKRFVSTGAVILCFAAGAAWVPSAKADISLNDGIFGDSATIASNDAITSFQVGIPAANTQQLGLQQFYYRVGNGPITSFGSLSWTLNTPYAPGDYSVGTATTTIPDQLIGLKTTYTLQGPALTIDMKLTAPTSGTPITLSIFQLSALNLDSAGRATSTSNVINGNRIDVNNGIDTAYFETTSASIPIGPGLDLLTSNTPAYQVGVNTSLFANLDGGGNTPAANLNNNGSYSGGNAEFAFEWTFPLNPGSGSDPGTTAVLDFSENFDQFVGVPEPTTNMLSLLGLAILGGATLSRRPRRMA